MNVKKRSVSLNGFKNRKSGKEIIFSSEPKSMVSLEKLCKHFRNKDECEDPICKMISVMNS